MKLILPSFKSIIYIYSRGKDCRSNLYLLPTGEIVYFVAAVVVLFNVEEQCQRHYTGHTDDVKCIAVHPNKLIIASGQCAGHDRLDARVLYIADTLSETHILVLCCTMGQSNHIYSIFAIRLIDPAISCITKKKNEFFRFENIITDVKIVFSVCINTKFTSSAARSRLEFSVSGDTGCDWCWTHGASCGLSHVLPCRWRCPPCLCG